MPEQTETTPSDIALLQAIARGDATALERLYLSYGPPLLAYLTGQVQNTQLAEEVLQDVMLAVWRGAASFRAASSVRTWLFTIARHRAITARQQRANIYQNTLMLDEIENVADSQNIEAASEQHDEDAGLRAALQKLPAEQRETLELIFYHELSGAEAAAVLEVAPGTVKSRLYRAKASLRQLLEKEI